MTVPARAPHTDAVVNVLAATGLLVAVGEIPAGAGWQGDDGASDFVPYLVVHAIPGGRLDGPSSTPDVDADWVFQVNAVGCTPGQCELAGDRARTALLAQTVAVPGRALLRVIVDTLDGPQPDDTVQPRLWWSHERYRIQTTPA